VSGASVGVSMAMDVNVTKFFKACAALIGWFMTVNG
jgi:hypothetical protein